MSSVLPEVEQFEDKQLKMDLVNEEVGFNIHITKKQ